MPVSGNRTEEACLAIPPAEFAERRERLRAHIVEQGLAGAVLFDRAYVLYYSAFAFAPTERPIAFVLTAQGEVALFVPRLEVEHARIQTGFERVDHYPEYPSKPHPMDVLRATLADMVVKGRVGVDTDGYPWMLGYQGPTLSSVTGSEVVSVAAWIERQMAVKSEREVALVREGVIWSNLAHRLLQRYTEVGAAETDVSMRASYEATRAMLGALGHLYAAQSFFADGVYAGFRGQVGRNGALPHALTNNSTFRDGDTLVTGAFAITWGYDSELERTMFLGAPTSEQQRLFEHMKAAQEIAFAAMRPGARCSEVDRAVRSYYERHDLMSYWRHHSGHAFGLRYHEAPFLDIGDDTVLQPGMVFAVEPGLYHPDLGGFRHSDTVVVTDDGVKLITYYPRDLESLTIC